MSTLQQDPDTTIREILRLRQVVRHTDSPVRDEIETTREFLEDTVGPTVRPALAARLLGISQPALHRWLDKGEIGTVTSQDGRREIPLSELLDLLEDVEDIRRETDGGRPLARVMSNRRRRAEESIDLDRLIPRKGPRTHRVADLHSLAYHRLVAERLDPVMVDKARRRLDRWVRDERIHPQWAQAWEEVLSMPPTRIATELRADTPRARELRQTSPFAGTLTEHERRLLNEAVERRYG
jgi:hypothetical protein